MLLAGDGISVSESDLLRVNAALGQKDLDDLVPCLALEAVVIVHRVGGNGAEQREQKTQRCGKAGSPFSCDHGNLRNER